MSNSWPIKELPKYAAYHIKKGVWVDVEQINWESDGSITISGGGGWHNPIEDYLIVETVEGTFMTITPVKY